MTDAPTVVGPEQPRTTEGAAPPTATANHPAPAPAVPAGRLRWSRPRTWPRDWLVLAAYWLASRLVMLALLRQGHDDIAREVHVLYHRWDGRLRDGSFPVGDVSWQYPPGAGLVMVVPGLAPAISYLQGFVLLMIVSDAVVLVALARAAHRRQGSSLAGAWLWLLGLPLLLSLPYARYDVLVTGITVLALLALAGRPRLGGVLAGLAAVIKVWPVLAVLGTPRGRTTREAWLALTMSAAALLLLLGVAFRGAFDFLFAQQERGVEIESMGGALLHTARFLGWPGRVRHQYGSFEFVGPYVSSVALASLLLTAVAFGWLLLWRLRARRWSEATPYDAALAAVLLFTATSRVISPQYLIWLIGLAAVCLTVGRTTQRPVAVLLLLAAAVTTVDYPLFFGAVLNSSWQGVAVVVLRNMLLLAATLLSCLRLWRATVPRPRSR
ncbi:glycosyltransferase family 87 protein [Streptomyces sp. NPDC004647]|uniref:glycosyltransferase family 87 protein n=1 Tax=Streptomyces sp. NPDC004647 TaxID=3154671 RepID=UPI0033B6F1E0